MSVVYYFSTNIVTSNDKTVVSQTMQSPVIDFDVQARQVAMMDPNLVAYLSNAPFSLIQKSFDQSQVP